MGLFDNLFSDDNAANLALAAGLLGGRGSFNQILGSALMQGQEAGQGAAQRKRMAEMDSLQKQRLQLVLDEEARRKKQFEAQEAFRASIPEPSALGGVDWSGKLGPTPERVPQIKPVSNVDKLTYGAMRAGVLDPAEWLKMQRKESAPLLVGRDQRVIQGGKEIVPLGAEKPTSEMQNYREAVAQGFKGGLLDYQLAKARAGATQVKIDNKLGEGLAKEVGPMIAESAQRAQGAQQQISNAETIIRAVDTNKLFAGPGSNLRLKGAQIGQLLGVGGKDAAETVANTRAVIQGLARATVAARGALKGQGQVSDFEGKLLAKAESGDIDDMTPAEIRYIASKNKEYGTKLIEQHGQLIKKARGHNATSGLADFFDLPAQGQTIDWDALPNGR